MTSIKTAVQDTRRIEVSLDVLVAVLDQLRRDPPDEDHDKALVSALQECQSRVQDAHDAINDLLPALQQHAKTAKEKLQRTSLSLKVASRSKLIAKVQENIDTAKTTLTLALLSSAR